MASTREVGCAPMTVCCDASRVMDADPRTFQDGYPAANGAAATPALPCTAATPVCGASEVAGGAMHEGVSLVVAMAEDGCIGRAGTLPWRIPSDLRRFRALTMGRPVVMGRRTWLSLPRRPLPGRTSIVLSRDPAAVFPGAMRAACLEEALRLAASSPHGSAGSIGGGSIGVGAMVVGGAAAYAAALPLAERIHLTRVHAWIPGGDTFFPMIDPEEWQAGPLERLEDGEYAASFRVLTRRRTPGR